MRDERINLAEDWKIISEEPELVRPLGNYFRSIIEGLDLEYLGTFQEHNNPAEDAIKTFESHPSTVKVKSNVSLTKKFHLHF